MKHFEYYAECIRQKLESINMIYAPGNYSICGFIDNTNEKLCRPGGGPRAPGGPGAERYSYLLQKAFYCKFKRCHALKWQTFVFPDGCIGHAFGGLGGRRNDIDDLNQSEINQKLANVQLNCPKQHKGFGDGIYPWLSHIRSKHRGNLTVRQVLENSGYCSVRESVEWIYSEISSRFEFLDFRKNFSCLL